MSEVKLKIWWIPQVPMSPFEREVPDLATAAILLDTLADYDTFQFENKIKPDYSNMGGLMQFDVDSNDWEDWYDPETRDDFNEWLKTNLITPTSEMEIPQ